VPSKCLTRQDTKRNGGMPGHVEPKKVGVTRHKDRGAADGLQSGRDRMGQPPRRDGRGLRQGEVSGGTETSQYPEEAKLVPE